MEARLKEAPLPQPHVVLEVGHTWDGAPLSRSAARLTLQERAGALSIHVDAPLHGDPPPDAPPGPLWGLWDFEVVELFVLGPGDRYTELEVGPHGHHLLLRLEGRRNPIERLLPVEARWDHTAGRWQAHVELPAAVLPPRPWRVNAYAISGVGPARRYAAWAPVPGPQPDFHRLEYFRVVEGL